MPELVQAGVAVPLMSSGRVPRTSLAALTILAGVTVMALSACAQIPTSGPVDRGDLVQGSDDEPPVRVVPRGPVAGQSATEVVRGFLDASASFEDDHAVARQFLTQRASEQWNPDAGVTVIDDNPRRSFASQGDDVVLSAIQTARVARNGAFTPIAGASVEHEFPMKREGDTWRIARVPQGLLLDRIEFSLAFRAFDIFFMSPERQDERAFLVADPVYLPVGRAGSATTLVKALLNGPTRWLRPAVESAIPSGTQLVVDSVPVVNGVAQVDLSAEFLGADSDALEMASAQITSTLLELSSSVSGVTITVEGDPLLSGEPTVLTADTWEEFDPDSLTPVFGALFVRDGVVRALNGDSSSRVIGPLGDGSYTVAEPSQSWSGDIITGLDQAHQQLLVSRPFGPPGVSILRGQDLLPATIDGHSRMWSLDVGGRRPHLEVNDGTRWRAAGLRVPRGDISTFRVSADGTRVAIVQQKGPKSRGQLMIGRVVQGPSRIRVEAFRRVELTIDRSTDASWVDSTTLVVLGTTSGSTVEPLLVNIDRTVSPPPTELLVDATSVVGAPGLPLLADTKGGILEASASGWSEVMRGHDPAYPG